MGKSAKERVAAYRARKKVLEVGGGTTGDITLTATNVQYVSELTTIPKALTKYNGLDDCVDDTGGIDIRKLYHYIGSMTRAEIEALSNDTTCMALLGNARLYLMMLHPDPNIAIKANITINSRLYGLPTAKMVSWEMPKNQLDHLINQTQSRI